MGYLLRGPLTRWFAGAGRQIYYFVQGTIPEGRRKADLKIEVLFINMKVANLRISTQNRKEILDTNRRLAVSVLCS